MDRRTDAPRLVVVDDDVGILDALCDYLNRHGFQTRGVSSGASLDRALAVEPADLIVLDLMMPGEDGLSICRRLRPHGPRVLMLSAMGEATDRIVGLEVGADDYLAKPFEPRELLARVRAILRRAGEQARDDGGPVLLFSGWRLNLSERELSDHEGRPLTLTPGEWALLRTFIQHPRRILSRERLMDLARSSAAETFDRAVDLQVSRLRRKLAERGGAELIETVRGEGYRWTAPVRTA